MKTARLFFCSLAFAMAALTSQAQDPDTTDLLSMLGEPEEMQGFASATFKGTRLVNFQTLEVPGKRTLEFRIAHRFGTLNSKAYNLFGLDGGASILLSFDYSYDGRFAVGFGRTSEEKTFNGFLKYRLIRQAEKGNPPLSVTVFSTAFWDTQRDEDKFQNMSSRFAFAHQVILGRKFNDRFSFQVSPTVVHVNLVEALADKNDAFILGFATRYKFTKRMALTAEYGWRVSDYTDSKYYDTLGIGFDLETGGHVFQVHLTNSPGILEHQFLTRTTSKWGNAGIRLGFNISRVFTI